MADVLTRARVPGWGAPADARLPERSLAKAAQDDLTLFHADNPVETAAPMPAERSRIVTTPLQALPPAGSAASPLRQHVAGLVQRLFVAPEHSEDVLRCVVFAGVDAGSGSSLLTAAAAEVLTTCVRGTVCIIDANLAAPSLHRHYDAPNDIGLAQLLAGTAPVHSYARELVHGSDNSLWLLTAGATPENGSAVLSAESSQKRLCELLKAFDYVLIDTSAITQQPAAFLAAQADGVVLVTEANITRRHVARAAAESLRVSGVRVLGTILNNRTFPIPEAVYRRL
jgi:Mrp family chromosome partitioning ATPase